MDETSEKLKHCHLCHIAFGTQEPRVKMEDKEIHISCYNRKIRQFKYKKEQLSLRPS